MTARDSRMPSCSLLREGWVEALLLLLRPQKGRREARANKVWHRQRLEI